MCRCDAVDEHITAVLKSALLSAKIKTLVLLLATIKMCANERIALNRIIGITWQYLKLFKCLLTISILRCVQTNKP